MKRVRASAPGKLMLFGEHAAVYGYPCIVTAVGQRIEVSVEKNGKDVFHLEAPDLGLAAYTKTIGELGEKDLPKPVRFVEIFYRMFLDRYPQGEGVEVRTKSGFSSKVGFGSSSAVTVAFGWALSKLCGVELSKKELFDLCYRVVIEVQGVGSGFDIAAAIWGGTLYYVSPGKVIDALKVGGLPMVVGYTGVKADTPTLVRMVASMRESEPELVNGVFEKIGGVVDKAGRAVEGGDWGRVGELMSENQELLGRLQVSSVELDRLVEASEKAGALGAKLSGAGGGDCMLALGRAGDKLVEEKIKKAIVEVGGEVMEVELSAQGVKVEG